MSTFQSNLRSSGHSTPSVPLCQTCGKMHSGLCHRITGAFFQCGQTGHLRRDCPQVPRGQNRGLVQPVAPSSSSLANQSRGDAVRSGGRGSRGRGTGGRGSGSAGRG